MKKIVTLNKNKPTVSTFDLFQRMGYKEHRKLKEVINTHLIEFKSLGLLPVERVKPPKKSGGGRPIESYLLNEDQFILLVVLAKNTPESVGLKVRICREFSATRKLLNKISAQHHDPEWIAGRQKGKIEHNVKSEKIKEFVAYAKGQGSKSYEKYYMQLEKMQNNALFIVDQKFKNLREVQTAQQLVYSSIADKIVDRALIDGMSKNIEYKKVYQLARKAVEDFSDVVGKTEIISVNMLELASNNG